MQAFQRQVHERLTQLELVNKQYRRLTRENRTDGASKLKLMVHEGNQRWDMLQKRVAAVLRRLKVSLESHIFFLNKKIYSKYMCVCMLIYFIFVFFSQSGDNKLIKSDNTTFVMLQKISVK